MQNKLVIPGLPFETKGFGTAPQTRGIAPRPLGQGTRYVSIELIGAFFAPVLPRKIFVKPPPAFLRIFEPREPHI